MERVARKNQAVPAPSFVLFVLPLVLIALGCTPSADNPRGRSARALAGTTSDVPRPTTTSDLPAGAVRAVTLSDELQGKEAPTPEDKRTKLARHAAPAVPEAVEAVLDGPRSVTVGQVARFRVRLSNRSGDPAGELSTLVEASQQIEGVDESVGEWTQEPDLQPGQSRQHDLQFRAIASGKAWIRVKVMFQRTKPLANVTWPVTVTSDPGATVAVDSTSNAKPIDAQPTAAATSESDPDEPAEPEAKAKPRDLGPPLVENAAQLRRLDPRYLAWLDPAGKRVVLVGEICQRKAPLEMFACTHNTKEHEAVVSVRTKAFVVHAGLLAVGAKQGKPVQYQPKYVPAHGDEIDVTVHWKDADGKQHSARAQDWVRDATTKKALDHPWVFGGSSFWRDEAGQNHYQADSGDFICVSNFPSAMLDLPVASSAADTDRLFEAFTERIPPLGTPVTVILAPKAKPKATSEEEPKAETPAKSKS